jgi:hypothetical protein
MAPNRKNVSGLVQALSSNDLESLQNAVQPKFLPLTDASESSNQPLAKEIKPQQSSGASYWEWPADAEIEQQQQQDLFSVSRIEANLIKDAATTAVQESSSQQVADHDNYWAEEQIKTSTTSTAQEEQEPIRAQHVDASYWEWPATQKDVAKACIQRILADEQARERTSAAAIERVQVEAASATTASSTRRQTEATKEYNDGYWQWESAKVASHVADASHPNANYWDWSSSEEQQKASPIEAILEYEAARELLTASNMIRQLQAAAPVSSSGTKASSDDYWADAQGYGDQYWQWPAESTMTVLATGQRYWDW